MSKDKLSIDYGSNQAGFMQNVMKTIVQQDDFRGIGGHELQNHGGHGLHSQTSIGLGNRTIYFREVK